MSEKFEYSDFYKFVTSAGVATLVLAFAVPWAFLHEGFDLMVPASALANLTLDGAEVVRRRQHIERLIFHFLPAICAGLTLLALALIGLGCFLWWKRQTWRDRAENAATRKAELELEPMTMADVEAKADVEVDTSVDEMAHRGRLPEVNARAEAVATYIDTEKRVAEKLTQCMGATHYVLSQQRLGPAIFDFILQDRNSRMPDIVIELKLRVSFGNSSWWVENARRAALAAQAYTAATRKSAHAVLLVLTPGEAVPPTTAALAARTASDRDPSLRNVQIMLLTQAHFFSASCEELAESLMK
jgi:hypothetical protein